MVRLGFRVMSFAQKGRRSWNIFTRRKWLESVLESKTTSITSSDKPKLSYWKKKNHYQTPLQKAPLLLQLKLMFVNKFYILCWQLPLFIVSSYNPHNSLELEDNHVRILLGKASLSPLHKIVLPLLMHVALWYSHH